MSAKIRALQAQKAEALTAMRKLNDAAAADNARDFTAEEQADFDKSAARVASLDAAIARETQLAAAEAQLTPAATLPQPRAPPGAAVPTRAAIEHIEINDNSQADPARGFRSLGEFARSVHSAWRTSRTGGIMDNRLAPLWDAGGPQAAAPGSFAGEGAGADGGFLIPPGFSSNVFTLALAEDSLLPYCDDMPIEGNTMQIPKDETTPWGTNGVRAYWQSEGSVGTLTKPVLGMMDLRLKKLLALTAVSDELLGDASALNAYLPKKMAVSIRWKSNESILFGSGNGTPLGAFTALPNSHGAMVVQAKDSGQATLTLTVANLLNMFSRLPPGSYDNAVWMINNTVIPSLGTLTLGNYPIFLPIGGGQGGAAGALKWTLLGRPVIITQHAKAFTSQGDVMLLDLSYYQAITKAEGIQTDTSMHLYFDADAMAFRTTFRMDGQPKIVDPISPANGSTTLSPFVQLQAR